MNFEEFLSAVMNELQRKLGDEYKMEKQTLRGMNNSIKHSLMLVKSGINVHPLVPMDKWYQHYTLHCGDISEIAEKICEICRNHICIRKDISEFIQWDSAKNNIRVKVINTEKNRDFLNEVPHRKYLDLSQIYYVILQDTGLEENMAFQIRNEHMAFWGVSESLLHDTAWGNMGNHDVDFRKMSDVLDSLLDESGMKPVDGIGDMPVYILGSKSGQNGAIYMCDEEMLREIGGFLKGDFWLLPSSVHEVLVIPKLWMEDNLMELARAVSEVNDSELEPEEILSYHVYYYNTTLGKMMIAE